MNVLFASWELDPLIKVGGLGDVARSLPRALSKIGIDVRSVLPYYDNLNLTGLNKEKIVSFNLSYGEKQETVEVYKTYHPNSKIPIYLLKNKDYLSETNFPNTYAFFDLAIVSLFEKNLLGWKPSVIHCNDLHTGLVPLLLKVKNINIKTVITIHNFAYEGFAKIKILEKLGINTKIKELEKIADNGQINFLLSGLLFADFITTVSPSYAKEIMRKRNNKMSHILRLRSDRVMGILNGIDNDIERMMNKKFVKYPFFIEKTETTSDWKEGKRVNKQYLQKLLGLPVADVPLLGFIGRFDPYQKGIDILYEVLSNKLKSNCQFVLLGSGNKLWEHKYEKLAQREHKYLSCKLRFDETMAHQIYASADFILIPSKYEPCGLVQMIAMYYGTLPIAHKTGGLSDTIKDNVTGFLFRNYSATALAHAIARGLSLWKDKHAYEQMVESAIKTDFSWEKSAVKYRDLYEKITA